MDTHGGALQVGRPRLACSRALVSQSTPSPPTLCSANLHPKKRSKKIQFIFPILIGSEFEEVGGSKVPACAFSWDLLAKLPELVPTAVLDLSWEALLRNEITPDSSEEVFKRQTVKDIVSGMVRNNLNK